MRLQAAPISYAEACRFVDMNHRHHRAPQGHKFSIAAVKAGQLVGVVMVGRPVSRVRDDGLTLEVTRLCSDGTANVCSFLYGKAARAAFALGYHRIGTYILDREPGTSLAAAGWKLVGSAGGGSWDTPARRRWGGQVTEPKLLFEMLETRR